MLGQFAGRELELNKALTTLPLAIQMTATMLSTVPASLLMGRFGRKAGFVGGLLVGSVGAAVSCASVLFGSLLMFTVGSALMGAAIAAHLTQPPPEHDLQFAAVEIAVKIQQMHFEQAVRLSPSFAPAWSGLSDTYTWAAFNEGFIRAIDARPKAMEAAERAAKRERGASGGGGGGAGFKRDFGRARIRA